MTSLKLVVFANRGNQNKEMYMSDGCTEMLREEMLEEGWHEYSDKYDQPPPMPNFSPQFGIWLLEI